jgi:hypothetical protein
MTFLFTVEARDVAAWLVRLGIFCILLLPFWLAILESTLANIFRQMFWQAQLLAQAWQF